MDTRTFIKRLGIVLALSPVFVVVFAHLIARIIRGYVVLDQPTSILPTSYEKALELLAIAGSGAILYDFSDATTWLEHLTGFILAGQSLVLAVALATIGFATLSVWQAFERSMCLLAMALPFRQAYYRAPWLNKPFEISML
jgi:hypothetical protein